MVKEPTSPSRNLRSRRNEMATLESKIVERNSELRITSSYSIALTKACEWSDAHNLRVLPTSRQEEPVTISTPLTAQKRDPPAEVRPKQVCGSPYDSGSEERSCNSPHPLDTVPSSSEDFIPSSEDDSSSASEQTASSKRKKTKKERDKLANGRPISDQRNGKKGSSHSSEPNASSASLWVDDYLGLESAEDADNSDQEMEMIAHLPKSTNDNLQKLLNKVLVNFEPTHSQIDKLQMLDINLGHVPFNHILSRGSGRQDVTSDLLNKGPFTEDEVRTISENWEKFCQEYGFDVANDITLFFPNPFTETKKKLSRDQRRKFCQYISQNLPDRHPTSVYRKFLNIYLYTKTGVWSPEEEELLLAWYNCMPNDIIFCLVGRILRRRKQLCYKKLLKLKRKSTKFQSRGDFEAVRTKDDKEKDLKKDRSNFGYPCWTKDENAWKRIATEGSVDVGTVKQIYFLDLFPSTELGKSFATRARQRETISRAVVRELITTEATDWNTVDWVTVGNRPHAIGAVAAYVITRRLTKEHVPEKYWFDLGACLNTLKKALKLRIRKNFNEEKGRGVRKRTPMKRPNRKKHSEEMEVDKETENSS